MAQRDQSNIVVAIDAELNVLERRIVKLRELRRLALELEGARLPAAAKTPAPAPAPAKKRSAKLQIADVMPAARDLLADGTATIQGIHNAIGRSRNRHSETIIEACLEELGAVAVGLQGRATLYGLKREAPPAPPADPPEQYFGPLGYVPAANGGSRS